MIPKSTIHRFSYPSFQRFEADAYLATLHHPNPLRLDPVNVSTETYCARFRDALRAFVYNSYPSELLTPESALATFAWLGSTGTYILSNLGDAVLFTPPLPKLVDPESTVLSNTALPNQIPHFDNHSEHSSLISYISLISAGKLHGQCKVINLTQDEAMNLQMENPSLAFVQEKQENTWTIS